MGEVRRSRRRVALAWAAGSLAVCANLPLWELWYIGSWEASSERGPLWWVLWHTAQLDPHGEWPHMQAGLQTGAAITTVVVVVAGVVGFVVAGRPPRHSEPGSEAPESKTS